MNFNIRNGSKLRYTIPAGDVGDNFLVVDPVTFEISFRTPAQVGALAIGGASGDVLYNNAGVIGGFGDWDTSRLEIGGNLKLGESAQAGAERTITADGSATDVAITFVPKGTGAVSTGSSTVNVGKAGDVLIDNISSATNSATVIRSKGTGSSTLRSPSGNVVLSAGASSEVVLGEATTAASTRIISVDGTPTDIDLILEPKGAGTVISEANFTIGSTSLSGSSRTIKSGGSASDVSLILSTKGNGSVSLISESPDYGSGVNVVFIPNTATPTTVSPVGGGTLYSSSQELVWFGSKSFNLVNQLVGVDINTIVANPTITEDGQGLVWDNTNSEYTLGTLTASAGGTNTQIQYNNSGNLGGFGSWDGAIMTVPGSFQIGDSGTAGTNRNITAEGSVGNVSITLDPKGTANIILAVDGGQVNVGSGSGTTRTIQAIGSSADVSLILAGQGAGSVFTGSNFYIGNTSLAGSDRILAPESSSTDVNLQIVPKGDGNLSLFSTTPTYGGGEGIIYIKSAGTIPTGSITGGGALYVTSSAIRFVNSSGTDYDLTQTAQVAVRKNSTGGDIGLRRRINFIEGTGVTMTITDDAGDDEIDVTINASGGGMGYTDEEAQDAVGSILTDTSTIDFTYDDATPTITADVISDSSVQRVAVRKNSTGGDTGTRRRLNFIEGANTSITLADDSLDNELDITIGTTGLIGGSTGSTDNAVLRADGTGGSTAQSSALIVSDTSDITLGLSSTGGTTRLFTVDGSSADIGILFLSKGSGNIDFSGNFISFAGAGDIGFGADYVALSNPNTLSQPGELRILEANNNGTNYISLKSPSAVTTNVTYTLPSAPSVSGYVLSSTTAGVMSWIAAGGTGDVVGPASATDNAIARFDTTTGKLIQNTPASIDDNGNLVLGDSSTGSFARTISAEGTSANLTLLLQSKGSFPVTFYSGDVQVFVDDSSGGIIIDDVNADTSRILTLSESTSDDDSNHLLLKTGGAGTGGTGNHNSGSIYLNTGASAGSGLEGSIALFVDSVSNWQSMEKGLFIANATTAPTGNPANGVFLYAEDLSASSKLKIRDEAGNVGFVPVVLYGSATLNFGSIAAGAKEDLTITVTGAAVGDPVSIGIPNGSVDATAMFMAWVSAADTVTVRCMNFDQISAIDPASATFKASVIKQ